MRCLFCLIQAFLSSNIEHSGDILLEPADYLNIMIADL